MPYTKEDFFPMKNPVFPLGITPLSHACDALM